MLNNYSIVIGFMVAEPMLKKDDKGNEAYVFHLVTRDYKKTKEVTCVATGKVGHTIAVYGLKGSFWAVGGVFAEFMGNSSKKNKMALKCLEIELLKKPQIPGISVEDFVGKYAPKQIIKRARKMKNEENS